MARGLIRAVAATRQRLVLNQRRRPRRTQRLPSENRTRSRALFTQEQIETDLDRLEQGQQDDGGWTFDWLEWSPGQSVAWRGAITLRALSTLAAHGRI
jgi:hypothetical protein